MVLVPCCPENGSCWTLLISLFSLYISSILCLTRHSKIAAVFDRFRKLFGGKATEKELESKFNTIYEKNLFKGKESISGPGSDLIQTEVVRTVLPSLLEKYGVKTMIDAPCGDFYWMRELTLNTNYIGLDIVQDLISKNQAQFGSETRRFDCVDIVNGELPKADLIFCRDCLVHLTYEQAQKAIANFKASGATYLLTTTFPGRKNQDLGTIIWRPLDLCDVPFAFPAPLEVINEKCTENNGRYSDKSLGLWKLSEIKTV